jgi:hypothetical protein
MDPDGDGEVSFEEFRTWYSKQLEQGRRKEEVRDRPVTLNTRCTTQPHDQPLTLTLRAHRGVRNGCNGYMAVTDV